MAKPCKNKPGSLIRMLSKPSSRKLQKPGQTSAKNSKWVPPPLARNSCKPGLSEELKSQIQTSDSDTTFETFATNLMEYVDIRVEDLGDRRYLFKPEYGHVDSLPGLDPAGMMATFDRTDALNRDDIHFFTPDHPLLRSALDSLLLESEKRQHRATVYQGAEAPGIFMEVIFLVECIAPRTLHVDRYLPVTPITLWMDHNGQVVPTPDLSPGTVKQSPDSDWILGSSAIKGLVKKMVKSAEAHMFETTREILQDANIAVEQELQSEIAKGLQNLARLNPAVDQSEIKKTSKPTKFPSKKPSPKPASAWTPPPRGCGELIKAGAKLVYTWFVTFTDSLIQGVDSDQKKGCVKDKNKQISSHTVFLFFPL